MAYQYPLNGGRINASIGGNSTSAGAGYSLISTGTMLLAGGNNITLSQNGSAVTISGGNGVALYDGVNSISSGTARVSAAGGLTASINGQTLSLSAPVVSSVSATGIVSISNNGSTVSIGAPAFSVGMSTLGNTSGTSGTVTNQLILAGGNNITLSQSTGAGGNTLTISAPNNPALSGSNGSFTYQTASFGTLNGISFYTSNGSLVASHNAITSQSVQTANLYVSSNSTQLSSTAGVDIRSLTFQGAGNVSVGVSQGKVLVSGAGGGAALSAGTQSANTGTVNFANSNGISFGMSGSNQITASYTVPSQSNQSVGLYALGNTTQSSSTTLDARSLSFNGLGGVSVGYSNGSIQISGGAGGGGGVALYDGVNSISSGTARVSAGGALTASVNGQTLSLNAPATSSLSATGAVSISTNGSTISIGAPSQTNQTLGISATSNTFSSSNGTVDARSLYLRGVGAASVGISNGSVLISAPNAAAGNVTFSAGTSSGGYASLVFSNSNGVSFGLNGSTITASAVGGGGGGVALYDGTNSISSGTAQISATGALTASINGQTLNLSVPVVSSLSATGAVSISNNAGTISIGAPLITSPRWEYPNQVFTTIGAPVSNSLSMQHVFIPFNVSARSARIAASISAGSLTTTGSGTVNLSFNLGLYSLNGSTLSLIASGSTLNSYQITASSTAGVSNILNGIREISAPLSANITPGDYWVGALLATAQTGSGLTVSVMGDNLLMSNGGSIGVIGSSASAANRDMLMGQGLYATAAIPSSIAISAINNTSNSNVMRAAFYHAMYSTVF